MEYVQIIQELIANLGLPVALVVGMGLFIFIIYKQSVKREDKLMEIITTSTTALEKISERLSTVEEDVKEIQHSINTRL